MIIDEKEQGYKEGIIALAYGLPLEAFNILLREQENEEAYEFCAGMCEASKQWLESDRQFNCKVVPRDEELEEDNGWEL